MIRSKTILLMLNTTGILALSAVVGTLVATTETPVLDPVTPPPAPIAVEPYIPSWKCPTCTPEEKFVLKELQEKTKIKDRNALATILGNIKQESKFIANICEGGARVSYDRCLRGGYGIIQWTTESRYNGLGLFSKKYGCDPSTLECQTRYMINENIFQRYLPMFEGGGQSVRQYMVPAYYWLGWGIKGNREIYSWQYTKQLELS